MEEVKTSTSGAGTWGMAGWNVFNTLLGAAGTAMGATALGVKANASHFNKCGDNWGSYQDGSCGHGCCGYSHGIPVNRFELEQNLTIANLVSKDYANQSDLKLFDDYTTKMNAEKERVNGRFETAFRELVESRERQQAEICRLDKEVALNKQANEYQFLIANQEFTRVNGRIDALTGRVNSITKEIIPIGAICPQPLAASTPIVANPQVITTTSATTEGEVSLNTVRVASK